MYIYVYMYTHTHTDNTVKDLVCRELPSDLRSFLAHSWHLSSLWFPLFLKTKTCTGGFMSLNNEMQRLLKT